MAKVFKPAGPDSVRHIETTKEERQQHNKEWKEDRDHKQKIKDERFAAIRTRRKQGPVGSGGINITVETEKK